MQDVSALRSQTVNPAFLNKPNLSMPEDEIKALLRKRGISTPDSIVLPEGQFLTKIPFPFPLVVKIRSVDVPHKTEIKGVELNITNSEALEKTLADAFPLPCQDLLVERMEPWCRNYCRTH